MQKRFSFPPLPRTALAIAAAALALSGCAGSSGSGTPAESYAASGQTGSPSNASSDAASEQARFDAFLAHQFQESVQDDPLSPSFSCPESGKLRYHRTGDEISRIFPGTASKGFRGKRGRS